MTRILAYTSPALGHLYPVTSVLEQLHRRGHHVSIRTMASQVGLMQRMGFDAGPIDPRIEARTHDDWRGTNPRQRLALAVRTLADRAEHDAEDLRRAIDETRPDLVLVDFNSWGAMSTAEHWGGPWAAFCPYPLALQSPGVPPFGPGLPPMGGAVGRVRDSLVRPLVTGALERTMLPPLNAIRAGTGLSPLDSMDGLITRIPLLLYFTAEPFEYHRAVWPDSIVMVGPCAWEPPASPPPWLADVEEPLVVVTTSSEFQDDGRLVDIALDALADEPVHVVATLPSHTTAPRVLPTNAHVERFVSHNALLGRAACAVTHGGMGATQKALAHGVPVCAVPFGRDQLEVARRIVVAGAGTRLPAARLTSQRLRAAVRRATDCRDGAARVAAGFAKAGGPAAAADAVEQRIHGSVGG